jgi:dCTP deaminase
MAPGAGPPSHGAFWSDVRWRAVPQEQKPVQPFHASHLEDDGHYLLSVGDEIYVSDPEAKKTIQKLTDRKPNFAIEPGQFAFLLTEETVNIPFDVIGFISIRAKIKFLGLVNISGFHVDPGYSGKLIFAVFNAGPTRIHLKKGDKIFPIWLADLDGPITRTAVKFGYQNIPSSLVNQISGQFTTAYQLREQIDSIKTDVTTLKEFRLYALVILGVIAVILYPTLQDQIKSFFAQHRPTAQTIPLPAQSPPAPAPSTPPAVPSR